MSFTVCMSYTYKLTYPPVRRTILFSLVLSSFDTITRTSRGSQGSFQFGSTDTNLDGDVGGGGEGGEGGEVKSYEDGPEDGGNMQLSPGSIQKRPTSYVADAPTDDVNDDKDDDWDQHQHHDTDLSQQQAEQAVGEEDQADGEDDADHATTTTTTTTTWSEWRTHEDEESGHTYYEHRLSGKVVWAVAGADADADVGAISSVGVDDDHEQWDAHIDKASGKRYFAHRASGAVAWNIPERRSSDDLDVEYI